MALCARTAPALLSSRHPCSSPHCRQRQQLSSARSGHKSTQRIRNASRAETTAPGVVQDKAADRSPAACKPRQAAGALNSTESTLQQCQAAAKRAAVAALAAAQLLAPLPLLPGTFLTESAQAVLLSPDTKVPRTAEIALRRSVPVINPVLRQIQDGLEEVSVLMRIPQRKPYGSMEQTVKKALAMAAAEEDALFAAVVPEQKEAAKALLEQTIRSQTKGLPALLTAITDKDAEAVSLQLSYNLDSIAQIAVLQAPGLPFLIPAQYQDLPRLSGRAVVEFTVLKSDGSTFTIRDGAGSTATGRLQAVLDGFSAPLTAGNFAKLVSSREFDGVAVKATQQAVLTEARSRDAAKQPDLPLELMPSGEFQPVYRTPLEVADGELPVLPMSVYGALVMSHSVDSDTMSSPSQFFFFLYDRRNSGLGGLTFDEGQFSVFGYVTQGKEILSQLRTGDVIQSARLLSGVDKLVFSAAAPSTGAA